MSNLRKAAEMALEGFEIIYEGCGAVKEEAQFRDDKDIRDLATEVRKSCNKYIKALRQALAQPDEALAERERCAKIALSGTGEPVQVATLKILRKERERIAANIMEIER